MMPAVATGSRAAPPARNVAGACRGNVEAAPPCSAVRILLVDDDDHAAVVRQALAKSPLASFLVEQVACGAAATERAAVARFDAIVLDDRLRGGDALELLGCLRAAGVETPALLLTNCGADDGAACPLRPRADAYLPRREGFAGNVLARTVLAMVERRELEQELARVRQAAARLDGALLMARALAHEINNALSPIVGFSELLSLLPAVQADATVASYVESIGEAGQQATERVQRLGRIVRLAEERPALDGNRATK